MSNTVLMFQDKYCKYNGLVNLNAKGLTIGSYKSAWLANLVVSYPLDKMSTILEPCPFSSIYHNDRLVILLGWQDAIPVYTWVQHFQQRVDALCGNHSLCFTVVLWSQTTPSDPPHWGVLSIVTTAAFHYLDVDLHWGLDGNLQFWIRLKSKQVLSYLMRPASTCTMSIEQSSMVSYAGLTHLMTITAENQL